ncbi:hypothetical protein Bcav_1248 [Beutenbergia cavernae DSM 12333]|uniref:Uncharacterized protein n=1 Tax=Beutenbergia cavernae (strain ATCC BAA-8 / DSM 12333 / CCUG 43141 / JCM 11478 / NBRC 16432 / NCIMB 13614 / HKI 0122) TaxID=471853 RepID=C5C1P0_BEUC1|nr:hypothetical protein [Beutenbergia cavernae]ACQ79508.1 hypothetical protein Bcav_1248 [Beutenbergia cavernae DSM 12333]
MSTYGASPSLVASLRKIDFLKPPVVYLMEKAFEVGKEYMEQRHQEHMQEEKHKHEEKVQESQNKHEEHLQEEKHKHEEKMQEGQNKHEEKMKTQDVEGSREASKQKVSESDAASRNKIQEGHAQADDKVKVSQGTPRVSTDRQETKVDSDGGRTTKVEHIGPSSPKERGEMLDRDHKLATEHGPRSGDGKLPADAGHPRAPGLERNASQDGARPATTDAGRSAVDRPPQPLPVTRPEVPAPGRPGGGPPLDRLPGRSEAAGNAGAPPKNPDAKKEPPTTPPPPGALPPPPEARKPVPVAPPSRP